MIQPIITSIVSRIAPNTAVSVSRAAWSIRVSAKANSSPNRISDRNAPFDAAAKTLLGTMLAMKSPSGGTGPAGATSASAPRRAVADSAGMGAKSRNSGVRIAALTALATMIVRITAMPRAATAPLRAASAVAAMPVTSSEKTSGITVIWSALSQAVPIGCATAATPGTAAGLHAASATPSTSPATSAPRIRVDGEFKLRDILALIETQRYHAVSKHTA